MSRQKTGSMTLTEASQGSRDRLASFGAPRANAIPAAKLHSTRVAKLKRGIVWGVGTLVAAIVLVAAYESLRLLPIDLRFAQIGLDGSRITIKTPKLVGYRQDGKPYQLTAQVGVQDMATPDVFELSSANVRLESGPGDAVLLTAGLALYNAKTDRADLSDGVRIYKDNSFDLALNRAVMDFKANVLTSDQPATLKLDKITITADAAEFSQNERRGAFTGHVHTVIEGDATADRED